MNKILNIILSIVAFVVSMTIIFMIILKLTNHSPTLEQINLTIISLIAVMVYRMKFQLGVFTEFMKSTRDSTNDLKEDIKELRQDNKEFKNLFHNIDKKLMLIEQKI